MNKVPKYEIYPTNKFKKDFKQAIKRDCNKKLLYEILEKLMYYEQLPINNKDHQLSGEYNGYR